MKKQKRLIRITAIWLALCILLVSTPAVSIFATATAGFRLAADCEILTYVHDEVFYSGNHVARLEEQESMSNYVFRNADGSTTIYYLDDNVKYVDSSGAVKEKNINLTASRSGYSTVQNDIALQIPEDPAKGIKLSFSGYDVSLVPQGGTLFSAPQKKDNSVLFPNYFGKGTILSYTPTLNGVKEDIILSSYTGVNSFTFLLNSDGLRLYREDYRYYLAASADAEQKLYLGDIEVYDAAINPSLGTMTAKTITAGQQYQLTVTVDEDFLTDPNTVYPVTIDPTLKVWDNTHGSGAITDAPIYQGLPTRNFGTYTYNRAGKAEDPYGVGRTVVRLTGLFNDANYYSANANQLTSVKFYVWDALGGAATTVNLHPLTSNSTWTETNVTWNNVGSYSAAVASASIGNGSESYFDITTLAKSWKNGDHSFGQCGFVLIGANENTQNRALFSSEHTTTSKRPYVVVEHTSTAYLPVSGYELDYEPRLWLNSNASCYAYALNIDIEGLDIGDSQPGGLPSHALDDDSVDQFLHRDSEVYGFALLDCDDYATCPTNHYRIAVFVDTIDDTEMRDYHLYRQNPDGTWSHKQGVFGSVTIYDFDGQIIYNPLAANRKVSNHVYNQFVSYYFVTQLETLP